MDREVAAQGRVFRDARLRTAIWTSALSKLPALAVQLISFPVILLSLGAERYAAFFALTSLLAWVSLLGLGLLPALTREVAAALGRGRDDVARWLSRATLQIYAGMAVAFLIGLFDIHASFDIYSLLNLDAGIGRAELEYAFLAVALATSLAFLASYVPALRAGYQELHVVNGYTALASLFAIATIWATSRAMPTLWAMILAVYLPVIAFQLVDLGWLALRKRRFAPPLAHLPGKLRTLVAPSLAALSAQGTAFINLHGSILIVSILYGSAATAAYGSVMRPLLIAAGLFALIIQPILPSIGHAIAQRDKDWIRRVYAKALLVVLAASGAAMLLLAAAGPWLFRIWLGVDLGIDRTLTTVAGVYFVLWMVQFLNFNVVLGLGDVRHLPWMFVAESALGISIGVWLSASYGPAGMVAGLAIAFLMVTGWMLPLRIWRNLARIQDS